MGERPRGLLKRENDRKKRVKSARLMDAYNCPIISVLATVGHRAHCDPHSAACKLKNTDEKS